MSRSIYDLGIKKGWTYGQLLQYLAGKKVKTIPSVHRSGHNYPSVFTFRAFTGSYTSTNSYGINTAIADCEGNSTNNTIGTGRTSVYTSELALLEDKINKTELKDKLVAIEDKFLCEKEELKNKIKALEELGVDEIEEELLDIVDAISTVNPKAEGKDKIKLAEALMKIINK